MSGRTFPESIAPHDAPLGFIEDDEAATAGMVPAYPAATLVVLHQSDGDSPPRMLMVQRSRGLAFAAGATVFPGGRVDDDDEALGVPLARRMDLDPRDAVARVAAIRETLEETGLGVGIAHSGAGDPLRHIREGLLAEQRFSRLLRRHGAQIDISGLLPFARWRPNHPHVRVFDTRFYLAEMRGALPPASLLGGENDAICWIGAAEALESAERGEMDIIFPTRRNLERLARFDSFAAARESVLRFPPRRITPFVAQREGVPHLCIPDDCGYPVTSETLASAKRD